jgi:hypothetical protein
VDQRVFGPYYGKPPEHRAEPTLAEQPPSQDARPVRSSFRHRIRNARKRRPPTGP